ncbi:MAG: hypothetical protein GF317_06740, partial [Candidatus Lokiarchaeota archaeon]|nr:hypothetical protein [Candidatus Lokiarchaeota archaeon]MBD3199406.1 hypothetical protein [Candidatus Lokiarchaeota archaeon]
MRELTMKKRREITLTHPRLIKIRQNFRELIFEEYTKRSIEISRKQRKLDYKTQEEEWDELQRQGKELEESFFKSIIVCNSGGCGNDGDRVYRPEDGGWFCMSHSKKLDRAHYLEDQVKKHFTFDQMERFLSRYGAYLARN